MKNYYHITFKYSENIYHSNIALAESEEKVRAHYTDKGYKVIGEIREWKKYEAIQARKRGKPIVEID